MCTDHSILLNSSIMRNVSDKSCGENQITHIIFNNCFSENLVFHEIELKNIVQSASPHMTIWSMRIAR